MEEKNHPNFFFIERLDMEEKSQSLSEIYDLSILNESKEKKQNTNCLEKIEKKDENDFNKKAQFFKVIKKVILSTNLYFRWKAENIKKSLFSYHMYSLISLLILIIIKNNSSTKTEIKSEEYINYSNISLGNISRPNFSLNNETDTYSEIFNAFTKTSFDDVKVVILGQDPYHGEGEANGLAFSLNDDVRITPSLRNIFKELESDLKIKRENKDLSGWAKQGVLLLNAILTVEKDRPLSHKDLGWEKITDYIIKYISNYKEKVVFILWGNYAKEKKKLIDLNKHFIIESNHPSPLSASRGFFGSKPFSKTNDYLIKNNQSVIDWSL